MNSYASYSDWKGWARKPFGVCSTESSVYFRDEMIRSGISTMAGASVLEIGFGAGEFAGWARGLGARYTGVELIDELVREGAREGFDVHEEAVPIELYVAPGSVDLMVAFDVFEHMELSALRQVLLSAHRALSPSGRLIARVPSGDSPFSRAIQHGDATHQVVLGSSMVRQLASEAGFASVVREPAFPLLGLGAVTCVRRALITAMHRIAFPFLSRLFMGGGPLVLTPNLVFVLVKS